jgi:gliding motility-associated-like protein
VSYNWSGSGIIGPNNTATISVNQGGTYTLVVTNTSNGCSSTITAAVPTDTNAPVVSLSNNSATLSCSSPTIQIDATATPTGTYSWTTSGGTIVGPSNTATLIAGSAGVYSVTVTGSNGCSSVASATVYGNSNAPQVTLSSNSATITCSNPSVSISATVPGTVTSASYSWSPASGISSGANSSTATFTAGGSYNLTVTDNSNGCSTTTVVNIVSDQNPPSVTLASSNASITCTNGTVDIYVSPVNTTHTYNWSGSGTFTGQGTPNISTTTSGTYQVVVTNTVNGCSATQTISIGFDNNLVLSVSGNTLVCQGGNIVINASGATNYTWTDGTNTYTTSNINIPANANTTFTLVGNTGACNSTTIIGVSVSPSINVVITASPSNSISIGESVQLNATGGTNYTWTPITGLDNPTSPNPTASPVQTTTYCVTGYNSNGVCSDTACRVIYVDTRCPELFVPNVFSPNDDGVNDQLKVYGTKCVKEFLMVIYDRWGEKVFETTDVNATWDGTYKGKDMSGATFVYYIKGLYYDNKPIDLKGNFTIVK